MIAALVTVYVVAVIVTFVAGMWLIRDSRSLTSHAVTAGSYPVAMVVVAAFMLAVCWPLLLAFFVGARVAKARGR